MIGQLSPLPSLDLARHFQDVNGHYKFTDNTQNTYAVMNYKDALPRAQLYYQWEPLDEASTLVRLSDARWNPKQSVLVPTGVAQVETMTPGTDPAEITRYELNTIELSVHAKAEAVLLLNDAYHTRWKAMIDGQPADIFMANHIMRGVRVPAGAHEIRFEYQRPMASLNGFRISSATLLVMIGASLFQGFRTLKRPKTKTRTDPES